jgi:hypothetical protein
MCLVPDIESPTSTSGSSQSGRHGQQQPVKGGKPD